jgi:hypothetical protein
VNYDTLIEHGLHDAFVTDVLVTRWGSEVVLSCLHDPYGSRRPFQIVFRDCHKMRWEVTAPENAKDSEAAIIDFATGIKDDLNVAIIATDIFELVIFHSSFLIEKDW